MNNKKCISFFKELASDQNLIDRALKYCNENISSSKSESEAIGEPPLNGFHPDEIICRFDRQSFVFSHDILDHQFVETQIGLYIKDDDDVHFRGIIPIGTYRLITTLEGEDEDDYFVLTEKRDDIK